LISDSTPPEGGKAMPHITLYHMDQFFARGLMNVLEWDWAPYPDSEFRPRADDGIAAILPHLKWDGLRYTSICLKSLEYRPPLYCDAAYAKIQRLAWIARAYAAFLGCYSGNIDLRDQIESMITTGHGITDADVSLVRDYLLALPSDERPALAHEAIERALAERHVPEASAVADFERAA
jgi:hypothetical protein